MHKYKIDEMVPLVLNLRYDLIYINDIPQVIQHEELIAIQFFQANTFKWPNLNFII